MQRYVGAAIIGAALWAAGCDAEPAASGSPDVVSADAADTAVADTTPPEDDGVIAVGADACCLALWGETVVWSEGGDIYGYSPLTRTKEGLVVHAGTQKDPVLSGGLLVWADDRDGDFDLWARELPDGAAYKVIGGAGDQDQPTLDGKWLAWIGRDAVPHDALQAEVWVMDVNAPGSARALTQDGVEQTEPHVDGDRVVWADYRASASGEYQQVDDPNLNNADIYGWDLAGDAELAVTTDPSKQLRPAIEGDRVVWLDWRGINPEPKYSEFQVFTKRLGELEERRVAWSSWERPELWQRPAIADGVIAWIAEPGEGGGFKTGVYAVRADGGEPWLVSDSLGFLDAVALGEGTAAWLGAGKLGFQPFAAPSPR
jgi:beta propeller repeat protein